MVGPGVREVHGDGEPGAGPDVALEQRAGGHRRGRPGNAATGRGERRDGSRLRRRGSPRRGAAAGVTGVARAGHADSGLGGGGWSVQRRVGQPEKLHGGVPPSDGSTGGG